MTIATVMANLTLARSNESVLDVVVHLAGRLGAGVIGLACCRPIEVICRDLAVPAKLFEEDRKQIARQMEAAEIEFRKAMANHKGRTEWRARTTIAPLAGFVANEARSADLIVTGVEAGDSPYDVTRQADIRDLVMRAGRPLLVVPVRAAVRSFDRVLVAWKDAREAQRAITDALPLLRTAANVTVVGIVPEPERAEAKDHMEDVIAWLATHGVKADGQVVAPSGANASQLEAIARRMNADLIVAGAYGYSRRNAWVLGGVTNELLAGGPRCALLAH